MCACCPVFGSVYVVNGLYAQKSKQDIDKPKVQSLEDILKELDEEETSDEELELERRMEELLMGELVWRRFVFRLFRFVSFFCFVDKLLSQ